MIQFLALATLAPHSIGITHLAEPGRLPNQTPASTESCYLSDHEAVAVGLKLHATTVMGQYIAMTSRPITDLSGYLDLNPKDSMAKQPVRVGHAAFKVSNSTYDGKPCLLFESDGMRTRVREYRNSNDLNGVDTTPIQRYRKVWLTAEGIPLRETGGFKNNQGTFEIDAKFKKDEIEITTAGPKGRKTATIYPAGGVESFANEFKPMVDGEKVLLAEKTFSRLDPMTGGIYTVAVKLGVKFEGSIFLKKFSGHRVDFQIGETKEIAFVSKDMDLLQVNLPRGESLVADIDPTERKNDVSRLKSGGG
ncbi:MAG: hypothetical protein IT203_07810 [Fimbriimonadaceae bacterium]|nr:hypothetical protein [Fimbriimonadaceae bacterium]